MIIRIILILVVIMTHFAVYVSAADAFDDDWMELQQQCLKQQLDQLQQDLKLQQQLLKQQLDQQRQDFKMQRQQFRQELRQRRQDFKLQQETMKLGKYQIQQFGLPRSFNSNLYIDNNFSRLITAPTIDPIIMSPRSSIPFYRELNSPVSQSFRDLYQESLTLRSLEAGGLTHISDHIGMFRNSLTVLREGLKGYKDVQLEWKLSSGRLGPDLIYKSPRIETNASAFTWGLSTGLGLGAAMLRDWDDGSLIRTKFFRSYTFEQLGYIGLSAGREFASPGIREFARWTHGYPELMKLTSLYIETNRLDLRDWRVWEHGLRTIGLTAAGYVGGSVGAAVWDTVERSLSAITYEPIAKYLERSAIIRDYGDYMKVNRQAGRPIMTVSDLYGATWLQSMGFRPETTGFINKNFNFNSLKIDKMYSPTINTTNTWNRMSGFTNMNFNFSKPKVDKMYSPTINTRNWNWR